MNYWTILEISPTNDQKIVKAAYSRLLKQIRPDQDPDGYQRLREAFDWARSQCKRTTVEPRDQSATVTTKATGSRHSPSGRLSLSTHRDIAKHMAHNLRERQAPPDNDTTTAQAAHLRQQQEQIAHDDARALATHLFNLPSAEAQLAYFESLIRGTRLLHLKTRSYFEVILANRLCSYRGTDMPYALVQSAANEFRWFEEQHSDPDKRAKLGYLAARLNTYRHYYSLLILQPRQGRGEELPASKLILGKYRPRYFKFIRFLGLHNRTTRVFTRQFAHAVDSAMCPELDTDSFHWWRIQLERVRFSAIHVLVAFAVQFFFMPWTTSASVDVYQPYLTLSLWGVTSVAVWALDGLYHRFRQSFVERWNSLKEKRSTNVAISIAFLLSVYCYRHTSKLDMEALTLTLIAFALLLGFLRFGVQGLLLLIWASAIYSVIYVVLGFEEQIPHLGNYALIWGFISVNACLSLMDYFPERISDFIARRGFTIFLFGSLVSFAISFAYFKLITLL
ncbi:hypothetical protein [Gilvimarinus algae]|uniref:J domain-containing protein n=1 Tax=Gilvimarinus algae TaxID=3058037 RepID=A0ABT8TEE1_9GAMM|nr:hypothetical protein [Gilvimarinus sp. SDUM040014]MDO3382413.1 hypothetical protein [Gilvimarinus sp. SDUM040014]